MTRTPWRLLPAVLLAVTALVAAAWSVPAPTPGSEVGPTSGPTGRAGADAPNVVLITTDDQTLADLRWMPRTRRLLGGAGTTFTDFVTPHPLCCPSRAQLLTGQYAQNNGVRANSGRRGGYDAFRPETALPVWLQDAGYTTGFVGKYINLYPGTGGREVGWDVWDATIDGLYDYVGFSQYDGEDETEPGGYHTTYVAGRTVEFIEDHAGEDAPFFVWSSYVAPHGVCLPVREIGCSQPPLPDATHAKDFGGVRPPFRDDPAFNRAVRGGVRVPVKGTGRVHAAEATRFFRHRLRALASVDDAVARIVRTLEDVGEIDDTVILFTSDNGYLFGEHRYTGKVVAYEQSLRVPLLVRGPGVATGVRQDAPAAMIDLAPTIARMAGARPAVKVDGRSLVGPLAGPVSWSRRTLLVQAGISGADRRNQGWTYRGVRTSRYTYVRWTASRAVELFDRRRDPHQLVNLASTPAYAGVRAELARRTTILGRCSGGPCRAGLGPDPRPRARR